VTAPVAPTITLPEFGERLRAEIRRRGRPERLSAWEDLVVAVLDPPDGPAVVLDLYRAEVLDDFPDLGPAGVALRSLEDNGLARSLTAGLRRVWLIRGTPGEPT
jgi:hypothetical protein